MKESALRKLHRRVGIMLALFIVLQAATGCLISFGYLVPASGHTHSELVGQHAQERQGPSLWNTTITAIHYGAGSAGDVYRILLGIGLVVMAVSGSSIFVKIRTRVTRAQ